MQLGRANAHAILQEKYPDFFGDKPILFSADGVKDQILSRYGNLVNQDYELLKLLREKDVDVGAGVEVLKKSLESLGAKFD